MNFEEAVKSCQKGSKITLPDWSSYLHVKDGRLTHAQGKMCLPPESFLRDDWEIYVDVPFDKPDMTDEEKVGYRSACDDIIDLIKDIRDNV